MLAYCRGLPVATWWNWGTVTKCVSPLLFLLWAVKTSVEEKRTILTNQLPLNENKSGSIHSVTNPPSLNKDLLSAQNEPQQASECCAATALTSYLTEGARSKPDFEGRIRNTIPLSCLCWAPWGHGGKQMHCSLTCSFFNMVSLRCIRSKYTATNLGRRTDKKLSIWNLKFSIESLHSAFWAINQWWGHLPHKYASRRTWSETRRAEGQAAARGALISQVNAPGEPC